MSGIDKILRRDYNSFFLIAGPCAVESYDICYEVAKTAQNICNELDIPFIFKSSFRKANRTKLESFQGIGDNVAIEILKRLKSDLNILITTDVHETADLDWVIPVVDLIQIPAFLCRQTALLQAAGRTGLPVNIKKGQFMDAQGMKHAMEKVHESGGTHVFLTERGNSFGYQDLVVDTRNIASMSEWTHVIMDCTHATQRPNQISGITSGAVDEIEHFAKVGLISGASGLFIETHPNPTQALSDSTSMLPLALLERVLKRAVNLSKVR